MKSIHRSPPHFQQPDGLVIFDSPLWALYFESHYELISPGTSKDDVRRKSTYYDKMEAALIFREAYLQSALEIRRKAEEGTDVGCKPPLSCMLIESLACYLVPLVVDFQKIWRCSSTAQAQTAFLNLIRAAWMLHNYQYHRDLLRMYHDVFVVLQREQPDQFAHLMANRNRLVGVFCEYGHLLLCLASAAHAPVTNRSTMINAASIPSTNTGKCEMERAAGVSPAGHAFGSPDAATVDAAKAAIKHGRARILAICDASIRQPDNTERKTTAGNDLVDTGGLGALVSAGNLTKEGKLTWELRLLVSEGLYDEELIRSTAESLVEAQLPVPTRWLYFWDIYDPLGGDHVNGQGWQDDVSDDVEEDLSTGDPPGDADSANEANAPAYDGREGAQATNLGPVLARCHLVPGAHIYFALRDWTQGVNVFKVHTYQEGQSSIAARDIDGDGRSFDFDKQTLYLSGSAEFEADAWKRGGSEELYNAVMQSPGAMKLDPKGDGTEATKLPRATKRKKGPDGDETVPENEFETPGKLITHTLVGNGKTVAYSAYASWRPLSCMKLASLRLAYALVIGEHPGEMSLAQLRAALAPELTSLELKQVAAGGDWGSPEWHPRGGSSAASGRRRGAAHAARAGAAGQAAAGEGAGEGAAASLSSEPASELGGAMAEACSHIRETVKVVRMLKKMKEGSTFNTRELSGMSLREEDDKYLARMEKAEQKELRARKLKTKVSVCGCWRDSGY